MKILFVLIFFLFGWGMLEAQSFKVSGKLKNIKGTVTYALLYGVEKQSFDVPIDGETFIIEGKCDSPAILRIYTDAEAFPLGSDFTSIWVVVYPGADITVDAEMLNYVKINSINDLQSKVFVHVSQEVFPILAESKNMQAKVKGVTASEQERLKHEADALYKKGIARQLEIITSSPSSYASLWYMEWMLSRRQVTISSIETAFLTVAPEYHSCSFYRNVASRIAGSKYANVGNDVLPIVTNRTSDGKKFDISSLRGKYVIIDFWGTWCKPCMAGMPLLREYRDKYKGQMEVVAIANDTQERWLRELQKGNMPWINILNGEGEENYVLKMNVEVYPTKFIVSPEGKILYRSDDEDCGMPYKELDRIFYDKLGQLLKNN